MRLTEVSWSKLQVGQKVRLDIPLDGVISRLDREPMIWISWEDGNRNEYHQSVLGHVTVLDERAAAHSNFEHADQSVWTDSEGE